MKHIHFLGIGGSGASAVAAIAQAQGLPASRQGFEITGCDLEPNNEFTTQFKSSQLFKDHDPKHLEGIDILAVTPAIFSLDPSSPELLEAKKKNIPILTWQEFMGKYLEKDKFVIAVCGTHGKSTTTALIGQLLEDTNLDPTVELGAIIPKWGKNFRVGKSKYFVTEADEFNDNFLASHPDVTILTNLEMDHPEYFKDFDAYKNSFLQFLYQTKSLILANLSDPGVREVMQTFQKNKNKPHHPEIIDYSKSEIMFPLKIVGEYNKLNATAVFQLGLFLNIDSSKISQSLMAFSGISRRFEYLGERRGAKLYSDFGHHPTEIKVTMEAARIKFQNERLIVVFQPHMFSRTKALFADFVKVFQEMKADQIFIIDIYPSREVDTGLISSKKLVEAINRSNVAYLGPIEEVEQFLKIAIRANDVVFFVGAGNIDTTARNLAQKGS